MKSTLALCFAAFVISSALSFGYHYQLYSTIAAITVPKRQSIKINSHR